MIYKEVLLSLCQFLEAPYAKSLHERKLQLIDQNHALGGHVLGYVFGENIWSSSLTKLHDKHVGPIHESLMEDAEQLHEDTVAFEKEKKLLNQGLSILLAPCMSYQDVRDALPDMLKNVLQQTSHLERHRPEAWTLEGYPLRQHGYVQTKQYITMFLAHRMLF